MAALTERIAVAVDINHNVELASVFLFLESDAVVRQALRRPDPSPSLHSAARVQAGALFTGAQHASNQLTRPILRKHVIVPCCTNSSASNLFLVFA